MKKITLAIICFFTLVYLCFYNYTYTPIATAAEINNTYYQEKTVHNRDGIGKFYLGREIAKVMGHQEMLWLERPSRENQEQPEQVIKALNLEPDDVIADIGAGTGYFSFRIAPFVPQGQILGVDIQPEVIDVLNFLQEENHVDNFQSILGEEDNPNLPENTVDLALMVDTYHEFSYPYEMMTNIVKALKGGGRVALVEYRLENPLIPIKGLHKMSQKQVKKEMNAVGLTWQETQEFLPQQHLMIFVKSSEQ